MNSDKTKQPLCCTVLFNRKSKHEYIYLSNKITCLKTLSPIQHLTLTFCIMYKDL